MNVNYHATGAAAHQERRAFERLRVRLPAQLHSEGSSATPCEIRDFCIGGMFVVFHDPAAGLEAQTPFPPVVRDAIVELSCEVPSDISAKAPRFRARVVRRIGTGLGLAFINPDLSALQALHQFVMQASQTRESHQALETTPDADVSSPQPAEKELLQRCARSTIRHGARLIREYLGVVGDKFVRLAAGTESFVKRGAYMESVRTFDAEKSSIRQTYSQALAIRLKRNNPDSMATARTPRTADGDSGLSLVEDDALEAWLAITEITHHIETTCQSVLFEIEQRLSQLFSTKINTQNNPLGPGVFVLALEDTLRPLPLEHEIVLSCYKVFKKVVSDFSPQFYGALNQFLIDQQVVLPDLNKKPIVQRSVPQHAHRSPQQSPAPGDVVKKNAHEVPIGPGSAITNSNSFEPLTPSANLAPVSPVGTGYVPGAMDRAPSTSNVNRPSPSLAPGPPPLRRVLPGGNTAPGNLYQMIGSLQSLQQNLHAQRVFGQRGSVVQHDARLTAVASASAAPASIEYSAGELVNAITALEQSDVTIERRLGRIPDLRAFVQNALKHQHGAVSPKQLGTDRVQVIDIANTLFQSLSQDRMLPKESREWLEKVELTMLKLALIDKSLFENREHVARQFVNSLAQLGLTSAQSDPDSDGSLHIAVDHLVDEIVQDFDGTSSVFTKANQEFDDLVRAQQHTYSTNVLQLTQACEKQERASGFIRVNKKEIEALDGKSRVWAKHAIRLEPGASVLFYDREPVQHLRLAWVNPTHSYYVFANQQGAKERELSLLGFAKMLGQGTAEIMDDIEEQPIDRAQLTILNDLHSGFTHDAHHDALTGTQNRREFERHFKHALQRAHSERVSHALCYLDIDKFQVINNTWGYEAGDGLLKGIAQALKTDLGDCGNIGRLASDEFMVLFEDVSTAEHATAIAERLLGKAAEFRLVWDGININATVSAGLVIVDSSSTEILDFIRAAQSGCKRAKMRGSNLINFVNLGDTALAHQRAVMDQIYRIDELLDKDHLALVCQKIEPLDSQAVRRSHYEVLLRVRDGAGKLISAGELIIAAEEHQRVTQIDRWVVRHTLQWMAEHRERLDEIGGMAINLSGVSLGDGEFMDYVLEQLIAADVPLEKVCFEITETAGIDNLSNTVDFILEMRGIGCLFSLDDFGTGLSSFDYLKKLPVDFLKIDGSFVQDICTIASDYAMVKSITEIGHFMGKLVIAEHARDSATLEYLRKIGVDYVQGFAIAKPIPIERLFA